MYGLKLEGHRRRCCDNIRGAKLEANFFLCTHISLPASPGPTSFSKHICKTRQLMLNVMKALKARKFASTVTIPSAPRAIRGPDVHYHCQHYFHGTQSRLHKPFVTEIDRSGWSPSFLSAFSASSLSCHSWPMSTLYIWCFPYNRCADPRRGDSSFSHDYDGVGVQLDGL